MMTATGIMDMGGSPVVGTEAIAEEKARQREDTTDRERLVGGMVVMVLVQGCTVQLFA